jgi:phosphoribosylaminoimidazolecarboxamide formyltransferase / IMP cyclohydrolase
LKKLALISVSDKQNIVKFARGLADNGYSILATGNTAKTLSNEGIEVTEISTLTGFPEIFSGRVKTLHPLIMGGILMRQHYDSDRQEAEANNITPIDIVCVNLYPFIKTASDPSSSLEEIIEKIDIGGPSLIRAAAKNYKSVSVLTDSAQYEPFLKELAEGEIKSGYQRDVISGSILTYCTL